MNKLLTLFLAALAIGFASDPAAAAAPVYTNKLKFRIPFHSDADELARMGAREIQLRVSRDRGRSWQLTQAVAPEAGKFNYQAPADGEYWFSVRTLDSRKRLHPEGDNEPGLQVIVDTTPPRLQIDLRESAPGRVRISWEASDEHLDLSQLRLEYIQPGVLEWESLGNEPRASGTFEWAVPQGGVVAVRGSIGDLAKNTTQTEERAKVTAAGNSIQRPRAPEQRQPVAGVEVSPFDDTALSMPDRFPGSSVAKSAPRQEPAPVATNPLSRNTIPVPDRSPFDGPGSVEEPLGPRTGFVSQRTEERPNGPEIRSARREPPASEETVDRRRVVNSKKFQIGYKLHDVAAASVAAVELYITADNGATWFRYPLRDDKSSPLQVEVDKEGVYGFSLGLRTPDGKSTDVPRDGDLPALEIVVDLTPPRLKLLQLRHLRGPRDDKVVIQWEYEDEYPAELPVSIYCAASPAGEWRKICDWTENSGKFFWPVDADLPPRFLVRIEARDKAGNIQIAETPRPVALKQPQTTARSPTVSPSNRAEPK